MRLPSGRIGERITINKKLVPFSFWPTKTGKTGNASLQSLLFSLDPWAIIDLAIKSDCPSTSRPEATPVSHKRVIFMKVLLMWEKYRLNP